MFGIFRAVRRRWLSGLAVCAFLFVGAPASRAVEPLPDAVRSLMDFYASRGVELVDHFDAPGGWIGLAVRTGGSGVVIYTDPEATHVFLGMMLGSRSGENPTAAALRRYFPEQYGNLPEAPPVALSDQLPFPAAPPEGVPTFSAVDLLNIPQVSFRGFDGDPRGQLYVFVDFACDHCQRYNATLFSQEVQEVLSEQAIVVNVVPVAFSGPDTEFKAALSLAMKPGLDVFSGYFDDELAIPEGIGQSEVARGASLLAQLMATVRQHGLSSVPATFLVSGDSVSFLAGAADASSLRAFVSQER